MAGGTNQDITGDVQVAVSMLPHGSTYPTVDDGFALDSSTPTNLTLRDKFLRDYTNPVQDAVEHCLYRLGMDAANWGSPGWNPLGDLIRPGDTVVVKPNWVYHRNRGPGDLDCLVTHASVLMPILAFATRAGAGRIILGDAPLQTCDLATLLRRGRYGVVVDELRRQGAPIEIKDFRRAVSRIVAGVRKVTEGPADGDYLLYDLGIDSLLEPISEDSERFRVTMYDPGRMVAAHHPGRHQYLVARDIIDANVVISVPKLKTHEKVGITGALKNLVGINGSKDYLPHHRKGGSAYGGDCYAGGDLMRSFIEEMIDRANSATSFIPSVLFGVPATVLTKVLQLSGDLAPVRGAWSGNDTTWRMCLDLNRILLYGGSDGNMRDIPQRKALSITDAIVIGEGQGPLQPTSKWLGVVTVAVNPVAADCVHAVLMGVDPLSLPIINGGFKDFRWPLVRFGPEQITIQSDQNKFTFVEFQHQARQPVKAPVGWW